jgi:fructose-1,6-bisphosphatase/inositol monophosphatase family enzyme
VCVYYESIYLTAERKKREAEKQMETRRVGTGVGEPLKFHAVLPLCAHFPLRRIDFMMGNFTTLLKSEVRSIRCFGSAACDICSVACGRLDVFYEWGIHAWDIAAAAIIVEEAGGVAVDPSGRCVCGGSGGWEYSGCVCVRFTDVGKRERKSVSVCV